MEFGLFNRIILHDVTLYDKQNEKLLHGNIISAKIEFLPLLNKEISLRSVSLLDGHIKIYKQKKEGELNTQFIVDALSSSNNTPTNINFCLNSFIIRRFQITYDERYISETPGKFNLSHIGIDNLNGNISLKKLTTNELNLRVRHISLIEKSGLDIKNLSFRLMANRNTCTISNFNLELPHSLITEKEVKAKYKSENSTEFFNSIELKGILSDIKIAVADISCFLPALHDYKDKYISLSTKFNVTPQNISLMQLYLDEKSGDLTFKGHIQLKRSTDKIVQTTIKADNLTIAPFALKTIINNKLSQKTWNIIDRLGKIKIRGNSIINHNNRNKIKADITTDVGIFDIAIDWEKQNFSIQAKSSGLNLANILQNEQIPQRISFHATALADFNKSNISQANLEINIDSVLYKEQIYKNISVKSQLTNNRFIGSINSQNTSLKFNSDFNGTISNRQLSSINLNTNIQQIVLPTIGISALKNWQTISGIIDLKLPQIRRNKIAGTLHIKNFTKKGTNSNDLYQLESLYLQLTPNQTGTHMLLNSDFANAEIDGELSLQSLTQSIKEIFKQNTPQDITTPSIKSSTYQKKVWPEWRFFIKLTKSDFFNHILNIPLEINGPVTLTGNFCADGRRYTIIGETQGFGTNGFQLKDFSFYLNGQGQKLSCLTQGAKKIGNKELKIAITNTSENGNINSNISWSDINKKFTGEIKALTNYYLSVPQGKSKITTEFKPTYFIVNDSIWHMNGGTICWENKRLSISKFSISHEDQSLSLDGVLSHNPQDSIIARLHKIDVAYILGLINLRPVSFAGEATGTFYANRSKDAILQINGKLMIPDFQFNDGQMGHADINLGLNASKMRLNIKADMKEKDISQTHVNGYVDIKGKELDLNIRSKNTNIHFLNRYISDFLKDIEGSTSGNCRIFGSFKHLDFEGSELVNLTTTLPATGCRYNINGGVVEFSPGVFKFNNFLVDDMQGGNGKMSGQLTHKNLKQICYSFNINTNKLLSYDKKKSAEIPFYATVIGNGNIHIEGKPGVFNADINIAPDKGTTFVYAVNAPTTFNDYTLLKFNSKEQHLSDTANSAQINNVSDTTSTSISHKQTPNVQANSTDIYLNFLINMQPQATLKIIMDEKNDDFLTLHGSGPLKATFYNKGSFQLYGKYTVEDGSYKIAIQNLIRKEFQFKRGGELNFSGPPYEGNINMEAVYTVPSVSLSDLGLGVGLSSNSVKADCILRFGGKALSPQISFDLNLSNVSDDVKYMVKQLISSEDDMNMQILYLLGIGRFYTYNFEATQAATSGQSQSSVAMKSFLSNTLSGQLNNIITNAVGSSKWNFGTNLSTGQIGWSDMEFAGILSGRLLNNRLLINGNFGYRDRPTSTTNFVGDFDINYLLTPEGTVSLKAYSETNDRYFSKSSMTTQGIGIMLKRDFTNLRDLFTTRKKKRKSNNR